MVFGAILMQTFVDGPFADLGVGLQRPEHLPVRIWAALKYFLQDGNAHKVTWHREGENGCKLCLLCRNIFSEESRVADEDGPMQLRCNVRGRCQLDLATSEELRETVRRLEAARATMTPDDFAEHEKVVGFNWPP